MSESDKTDRNKGGSKSKSTKKSSCSWALRVFLLCRGAVCGSEPSRRPVCSWRGAATPWPCMVLAVFIGLGIVFDMIGVAVTAADPRPFHSMAAHKEKGAKEALVLLRNARQVSPASATTWWATSAASSAAPRPPSSWCGCRRPLHLPDEPAADRGRDGADLRPHHRRQGAGQDGGHQRVYRRGVPGGPAHAYPASLPMKWRLSQLAVRDRSMTPADVKATEPMNRPGLLCRELRTLPGGAGVTDRRASGIQSGRGGADGGHPPGVRHVAGPAGVRRGPPVLRPQGPHRAAGAV